MNKLSNFLSFTLLLGSLSLSTESFANSSGISQTSYTAIATTSTRGSLKVNLRDAVTGAILPNTHALWTIQGRTSWLASGIRVNNLVPGDFVILTRVLSPSVPQYLVTEPYVVKVVSKSIAEIDIFLVTSP